MPASITPPNSIVFIVDPAVEDVRIPVYVPRPNVLASDNCISVGTLSEMDGDTTIELIAAGAEFDATGLSWTAPIKIATPSRRVAVVTARNVEIATVACAATLTAIAIGSNDDREPDRIVVRLI